MFTSVLIFSNALYFDISDVGCSPKMILAYLKNLHAAKLAPIKNFLTAI